MSANDLPKKAVRRIAELTLIAKQRFDPNDPAAISPAALFFATEVVGSKKFPPDSELATIISLLTDAFTDLASGPEGEAVRQTIRELARAFRHELRFGIRKIGRGGGCFSCC